MRLCPVGISARTDPVNLVMAQPKHLFVTEPFFLHRLVTETDLQIFPSNCSAAVVAPAGSSPMPVAASLAFVGFLPSEFLAA